MIPSPPTQAWAIKAPDGDIIPDTTSAIRLKTLRRFFRLFRGYESFGAAESEGYRCVRVEVREIDEG
jgi:hypothetical protein